MAKRKLDISGIKQCEVCISYYRFQLDLVIYREKNKYHKHKLQMIKHKKSFKLFIARNYERPVSQSAICTAISETNDLHSYQPPNSTAAN